ncbi:class I SAM-dependent methyltransferase [Kitasatospora cinereorecta]|uniref:Class I SAM-dependent methyltransferase n=1 Tax=Kitasatospora cinereorecta TaxID=285560 RepID=A0ABW0VHV6_9ACTN
MEFAEFERQGWARRSGSYDSGFGAMTAGLHARLLDAAGVGPGTRLVEVGCGTGRLAGLALARGARVVATDAVPEMVKEASAVLPGAEVAEASLPGLPFPDGAFEAAVGAFVINHVPDPPAAAADLRRVLAPGGRVALSCWDALRRNRAQGVFFDAVAQVGVDRPEGLPSSSPFAAHASPDGLAALLAAAGFTDVRVERVGWTHRVDPEQWWHDVLGGTVLTSALIEGRPPAEVERIRAAYHRLAAAHPDGFPVAALLATGTRP